MPITSVTKDAEALTLTVVADFDVPLRRLWDAYLDPRLLERFWGPPTYPAIFTRHDGCVGGRSEYAMTGPEGDISRGYWEWLEISELAAHQEPGLLRQWLLGPDGWTMPMCEVATEVGQSYRYEWEKLDGSGRFGFTGQLLEILSPHRSVSSESMIGTDGPRTTNELTLTAVEDGTLLSLLITYPDAAVRDAALATGMTDGMEASYARLESVLGQATSNSLPSGSAIATV